MTYHFQNPSDAIVKHYLKNSKVIAVVQIMFDDGITGILKMISHRLPPHS